MSGGNIQLETEFNRKHFDLKKLVEDKKEKERTGWLADEEQRKKKNDLHNAEQE